jgi:hypothetical protein
MFVPGLEAEPAAAITMRLATDAEVVMPKMLSALKGNYRSRKLLSL